jgi:hypothetical protein
VPSLARVKSYLGLTKTSSERESAVLQIGADRVRVRIQKCPPLHSTTGVDGNWCTFARDAVVG